MFLKGVFSISRPAWILFVALLALLPSPPAQAQEVAFTTVSKAEFGGSMGQMMRMVPGAADAVRSSTFVKGSMVRTDSDDSSTIMNAGEGTLTFLQHQEGTYYTLSMEEMAAMARMGGQGVEDYEEDAPEFEARFHTERTGRIREVNGFDASEVLMIVEMEPPEEVMEGAEAGRMVLFTQLWLSADVPGYEAYVDAQKEFGAQVMRSGGGQGLAAAFAADPRMAEAVEANQDALKDLEGLTLRSTSVFLTLPPGAELDRDAALASLEGPLPEGGGLGDLAAEGAAAAARDAMKNLGGMLGRRNRKNRPQEAAAPQGQSVIMRMTTSMEDFRTGGVSNDLFQVPAGYTEVDPEMGMGRPG